LSHVTRIISGGIGRVEYLSSIVNDPLAPPVPDSDKLTQLLSIEIGDFAACVRHQR
jgi:hypothetical protein